MAALAALALRDRDTAVDAATRFLGGVDPDDPMMRGLLAERQVFSGDIAAAGVSVEHAAAGARDDPARPVRQITGEVQALGGVGLTCRFLAEGYHRTGRDLFADMLADQLPSGVRHRGEVLGVGVGVMLLSIAGGLAGGGVWAPHRCRMRTWKRRCSGAQRSARCGCIA